MQIGKRHTLPTAYPEETQVIQPTTRTRKFGMTVHRPSGTM